MRNNAATVITFLYLSLSSMYGEDGINVDMKKLTHPNLWKGIKSVAIFFDVSGPMKLDENSIREKVELEFRKAHIPILDLSKSGTDCPSSNVTVHCLSLYVENLNHEKVGIAYTLELTAEVAAETNGGGFGVEIIDHSGTTGTTDKEGDGGFIEPMVAGYADIFCNHILKDNP